MPYWERVYLLEELIPQYLKEEAKLQAKRDKWMVEGIGKVLGVASLR